MFKRKTRALNFDGITVVLTELTYAEATKVNLLEAESGKVRYALFQAARKEDGSYFFKDESAVEELPISVLQQLSDALGELNRVDPKK